MSINGSTIDNCVPYYAHSDCCDVRKCALAIAHVSIVVAVVGPSLFRI